MLEINHSLSKYLRDNEIKFDEEFISKVRDEKMVLDYL